MFRATHHPPRTVTPAADVLTSLDNAEVIAAFFREASEADIENALTLKHFMIAAHVYLAGAPLGEEVLVELVEEAPVRVRRRLNRLRKLDWIALQTDPGIPDRLLVATSPHGTAVVERWIRHV